MLTNKFYSGVGSRQTPDSIMEEMAKIASTLEEKGYTLRSGNAPGADQAFASGVKEAAQIWLPWKSFEKEFQEKHFKHTYKVVWDGDKEAFDSVAQFHPSQAVGMKDAVLKLMARNYRQIIGKTLPNSEFIVCWTKDGKDTGGTGQAWRIGTHYNVPIYNMYYYKTCEEVLEQIFKNTKRADDLLKELFNAVGPLTLETYFGETWVEQAKETLHIK